MKNDLENKLAKLREDYKNKLPDKINEINNIWKNVLSDPKPENLSLFHMTVHKLHGSADTYGYMEIGKVAGSLEMLASTLTESPDQLKESKQLIEGLIGQLKTLSSGEAQPKEETKLSSASKVPKQEMIVYLLDDDISYENNLATQLIKFGYKVNKFVDSDVFLDEQTKQPADIMVLNINLVNNQLEKFLIETHKQADAPKVPIIFVSTSGEFSLRLRAVRMGGVAFYIRPFKIDDFITLIDQSIKSETEQYRILIVDDEIEVASYNAAILEQANMKTSIITTASEIDKMLHEFNPDLILIDINMPDCNGVELAAIIRQQSMFESTPIIYLSAEGDQLKQLNAMKLGADDFITKSTSAKVLVMTVKNRVDRYKKLRSLLVRDNLTGLYNYSFIRNLLEIELKESMLLHNPLSLAVVDLDKFKNINETYGHQAGDHVLKSLGLMLRKRLRPNDIIGRYSGAKFLVILPNTSLDAAKAIIEELRKHFLTLNYSWNRQIFNASFSAGIASFPQFHTVNELIEAVDDSISKSKKSGMNRVDAAT